MSYVFNVLRFRFFSLAFLTFLKLYLNAFLTFMPQTLPTFHLFLIPLYLLLVATYTLSSLVYLESIMNRSWAVV